ncbi:MAG: hypothetical protein OHK0045_23540 [Raineya sp.]
MQQGKNVVFTATPNANFAVSEWRLNNNVVSGNTTNTFTLENLQAAANVVVDFVTTITALSTLKEFYDIHYYPNPFTNSFTIENNKLQLKTIVIQNSLGKTIRNIPAGGESRISINTESFASGMYLVSFQTKDGKTFAQKLLKH